MERCIVCKVLLSPGDSTLCKECHRGTTLAGPVITRRAILTGLPGLVAVSAGTFYFKRFPDESVLSSFSSNPVRPVEGKSAYSLERVFGMKWSPNGKYIATGGNTVQIWDIAEEKNVLTCSGHADEILSVSWSPDSKYLASASFDQTVRIWDVLTGENTLIYRGHTNWVRDVAWSPNGRCIASAGYDKTVQLWDPFMGEQFVIYTEHSSEVIAVIWSPDGAYIASVDAKNTVKVW